MKQLNKTFEQITELVGDVRGSVGRIAQAAEEKVHFAESASSVIHELSSSAQQSSQDVSDVLSVTCELLANTENLKEIVNSFDLEH